MNLTIAGKERTLKFGLKFIRELDKVYTVDYQGMQFGMGINLAFMSLTQLNPSGLVEVIKAATSHEESAPTIKQVDAAIEDYADEHDGLEFLFEAVQEELGNSKVVKDSLKQFKRVAQAQPE